LNIDYYLNATGDPDKDTNTFKGLIKFLQMRGGGYIGIKGVVKINDYIRFGNYPIWPVGCTYDAAIEGTDKKAQLSWGDWYEPLRDSFAVPFSGIHAKGWDFEIPPGLDLKQGDIFAIWSDDHLTGMPPHLSYQCPMEIHEVKEIRGNRVLFDDFVADDMLTNPKIVKLNMIPGGTIADLDLRYSGTEENPRFIDIRNTRGLNVENVNIAAGGPGPMVLSNCVDTNITNYSSEGRHNYALGYGYHMVASLVNGLCFQDSEVKGVRHPFTTTGVSVDRTRWGTPRNVVIKNVRARQNGRPTGGMAMFDTHAEGWGIVFDSCKVTIPGDQMGRGFNIRTRNTSLLNCEVEGGGLVRGIHIDAADCRVIGGSVRGCWLGICVESIGAMPANCLIQGVDISDCSGTGIHVSSCDELDIVHNTFRRNGWRGGSIPKSHIWFKNANKASVRFNSLDRYISEKVENGEKKRVGNDYSVYMEERCANNVTIEHNGIKGYDTFNGIWPPRA